MHARITKITVTKEDGTEETWEGEVGHVDVRSTSKKGQPYVMHVTATLRLPTFKNV